MRQLVIDRRTFLKAAGISAAGVGVAGSVLAGRYGTEEPKPLPGQVARDPITAQAEALDYDRDRIFRFVADEVAYEPYSGVLRGATTTLLGRAGNSADKAVLLAALLAAAVVETRFVAGQLDQAAATILVGAKVTKEALRSRAEAALVGDARAAADPSALEALDPAAQAIVDRLPEIDASVTAWASDAVDTTVRQLTDALAGASITLPSGPAALPATELTRHLWVQARSGADWVDLDPTIAATEPGTVIAAPGGEPMSTVPDDLRHRLDIDVVLEKVAGESLVEEAIIEQSRFADELTDVAIAIGHAKPEALKGLGAGVDSVLLGGTRYLAALQVGQTAYIGLSPLILAGDAADPSAPTDPFSGLGSGPRAGEAVAEWLDLRITAPDGSVATARRTLFDRIGEEARREGPVDVSAIPPAELHDLDADHRGEFLPLTVTRFLSVATGATTWPSAKFPEGQDVLALGIPAQMYHVTRDVTNAILSPDRGVGIHLTAPNVTMHSYEPVLAPDGSLASVTQSLDLLHRGFGARAASGTTASVPAGLLAGVTSHVAERLRGGAGLPADLLRSAPAISVGALFERAASDGIALRVFRDSLPTEHGYPPAAADRLARALGDGWVAIVPERPLTMGDQARLGWWLVDPATGHALDQMDDGRGSAMVEWAFIAGMFFAGALFGASYAIGQCVSGAFGKIAISLSVGATTATLPICG